jgi:hypothetical protein
MNDVAFFKALSRRTPLVCNIRDPLAEARRLLKENGETAEGQALRKVITTLITGREEFSESELELFSAKTCALVAALVDARVIYYFYTEEEWREAQSVK